MDIFDLSAIIRLDSSEYESGLSEAEDKFNSFGKAIGNAAKVGAVAVGAVGTAVVGIGKALVSGTGAVASYGDNIDKMSQKMGISAEAYQEWDAVMQHSGTSMEAMKASMKTLANAVESGNEAFQRIGITQEELASMSQQEIFEATIAGLQNVEDTTERTYLAGKLLGRGATELGALLNTSAEDTQAMRDRVHELDGVMSDEAVKAAARYQDSLQDMTTALDGTKRNIQAEFLPSMATIMDGLTEIFAGYNEEGLPILQQGVSDLMETLGNMMPRILLTARSLVEGIGQAIIDNLPSIVEKGVEIVISLISGLISALPQIAESAITVVSTLVTAIISNLPVLLEAGINMLTSLSSGILAGAPTAIAAMGSDLSQLVANIMQNLPAFLQKGVQIISNMAMGLAQNAPAIIAAMISALVQLIGTIANNLPQFLSKGIQIIGQLAVGLIQAIPTLVSKIPTIIASIVNGFASFNWLSIGTNIISGIASGIANAAHMVVSAITNIASSAFNGVLSFFGIKSPSRLMRDKVGKMIPAGMALGIKDNTPMVVEAIEDMDNDAFDSVDDIGYDTDTVVKRIDDGDEKPDSRVANLLQRLIDDIEYMDEGLYEKMAAAFSDVSLEINDREFGRLVNAVRTS